MARLLPLVLVSGELRRLQAGDSLTGASLVWTGSGNPDNAVGNDGDLYFNSLQGDIWNKQSGSWVLYGSNSYFIQGKGVDGSSTTSSPTDGYVLTYDASLFSGVGGWKAAVSSGGAAPAPSPFLNPPIL